MLLGLACCSFFPKKRMGVVGFTVAEHFVCFIQDFLRFLYHGMKTTIEFHH